MVKLNRIYILIILSTIVLVLNNLQFLNFIKNPLDSLVIPLKKNVYAAWIAFQDLGKVANSYSQMTKIIQEKEELTRKQEELMLKADKLEEENLKLRIQLEAPLPSSFKFVPAQIISYSRFLEIDLGAESGIKKDQIVVLGQTLVGKVAHVSPKRSKVILLTDPDFKITAATSRGARGEVVGQTQGVILLTRVLQKDQLFLSDIVYTAGEEFVPADLLIGKINFIKQEETASYKSANITSPLNLDSERLVFIITSL